VAENPFLLPPGSMPGPRQEPAIVPTAAPPSRDPDRYIALPPSIQSATHRIPGPETAPTVVSPAVPSGTPLVEPEPEPAPEPAALSLALVLPDGGRLAVDGPLVLGRDPAPPASAPAARIIPLDDSGKTVSKTHALLEPEGCGIRVTELHSTNGVAISSDGVRTVLAPGSDGIAPIGSVIEFGSFTVLVEAW
jgi:hypothetical protein